MLLTVKVPEHNVQRLRLKVGDGMIVNKSKLSQDRFYGEIIKIELEKSEGESSNGGGGGFTAG